MLSSEYRKDITINLTLSTQQQFYIYKYTHTHKYFNVVQLSIYIKC
jgi:hypothetical protein